MLQRCSLLTIPRQAYDPNPLIDHNMRNNTSRGTRKKVYHGTVASDPGLGLNTCLYRVLGTTIFPAF